MSLVMSHFVKKLAKLDRFIVLLNYFPRRRSVITDLNPEYEWQAYVYLEEEITWLEQTEQFTAYYQQTA